MDLTHGLAVVISLAYLSIALLMGFLWIRYRRALCVHSPIWLPLTLFMLSGSLTNSLVAFDGNLRYPDLWAILRSCVAVTSWCVFLSFLFMVPRVRASQGAEE